jgi:hypothetical protein
MTYRAQNGEIPSAHQIPQRYNSRNPKDERAENGFQWVFAIPRGSYKLPRHRSVQVNYAMCCSEVLSPGPSDLRVQEPHSREEAVESCFSLAAGTDQ